MASHRNCPKDRGIYLGPLQQWPFCRGHFLESAGKVLVVRMSKTFSDDGEILDAYSVPKGDMIMTSKISQLRAIDAQIVQHVIDRGKLWEKRERIAQSLAGSSELSDYQAELAEWLTSMSIKSKDGNSNA